MKKLISCEFNMDTVCVELKVSLKNIFVKLHLANSAVLRYNIYT